MKIATPLAGVIDLGSNSIKGLVATRDAATGRLIAVEQQTLDVRISRGISAEEPHLSEAGMNDGVEAVAELLGFCREHGVETPTIVATSAVRDARNGNELVARVKERTGLDLRVLPGDEEARLIGRGLLCDPALREWRDFHVFDLGGGSLECLSFKDRQLTRAISLPLGCVRVSEKLVADTAAVWDVATDAKVRDYISKSLSEAEVTFDDGPGAPAVFCGGTLTTSRSILAEARGINIMETTSVLSTELLAAILKKLGRLTLDERREVPGLPERRADVIPTALATVLALADYGKFGGFQHSFYNLRWGIADSLLPVAVN